MELVRTVHPVGQGGFYTESFRDENDQNVFTAVYDCGGSSEALMKKYIDRFFIKDGNGARPKIDAVFISHLHADHINGLKHLLKKADVKYLFLPQMTEDMIIEVLFYNIKSAQGLSDFVLNLTNPEHNQYGETRIIRVKFAEEEQNNIVSYDRDDEWYDISSSSFCDKDTIPSRAKIINGDIPSWVYIPYNPPIASSLGDISSSLKKYWGGLSRILPKDIPDLLKKTIEKDGNLKGVQSIYNKVFGRNHNAYSMALFSGMMNPKDCHCDCEGCCECYLCTRRIKKCYRLPYVYNPNCLYTGDFEVTNVQNMILFYDKVWNTIRAIQVPHHGSRKNYSRDLYEHMCRGYFSVGERNRFKHPNVDTLINIKFQSCAPIVVTENMATIWMEHYEL